MGDRRMRNRAIGRASRAWIVLAALAAMLSTGCWSSSATTPEERAAELKKKKLEQPFEELRVFSEPNELSSFVPGEKESTRVVLAAKPGHWAGFLVQARANLEDVAGRLETTPQNAQQRPIDLENTRFWLSTLRGATLPKEQRKILETLFFPPKPAPHTTQTSTWIGSRLSSAEAPTLSSAEMISHMPSYQYFLVVLSEQADRYRYLVDLPSVRPPAEFSSANIIDTYHYRVLFPRVDKPLALARNPLCWTSTAHVVWDDVSPKALEPEQQRALVDWLHWGGGLVISGPDSLDQLKGSFLEPYLPATAGAAGPIEPAKLAEFHKHWTILGDASEPLGAKPGMPWSGIELVKHDEARLVPGTAGLALERRVGQGRIVVTAFRLTEPELTAWPSFDGFFNAGLLGRPPRKFDSTQQSFVFVGDGAPNRYDASAVTHLRYFTRDEPDPELKKELPPPAASVVSGAPPAAASPQNVNSYVTQTELIDVLKGEPGQAAWNDQSWISSAARETLREAAGISVPRRQFVFKMVGLYLLVIVPLNWLVFRLLGRVEWAWFAVPAVAVAWGVLVVWLAQLDIGFARAQTEVDVLELQGGYGRGHLTRYVAMYTSLASDYELRFDDPTAVALPLASENRPLFGTTSQAVKLTTAGERDLTGYPVASNATGLIHGEQIVEVGGGIHWHSPADGAASLRNDTSLTLRGAAILRLRRDDSGRLIKELAWLGDLAPGRESEVRFTASSDAIDRLRQQEPLSAELGESGGLSLRKLINRAQNFDNLRPGDVRLVAWHDQALPGMEVTPSAAQTSGATLIVAQLAYADRPEAEPDENLLQRRAAAAIPVTP